MRDSRRILLAIGLGVSVVLAQAIASLVLIQLGAVSPPPPRQIQWGFQGRSKNEVVSVRESRRGAFAVFHELDFQIGKLRDIGLEVPILPALRGLVADKNHLWAVYANKVTRINETDRQDYAPTRMLMSPLGQAFMYRGELAIVDLDDDRTKHRLFVFRDGQWQNAGEVGIPGEGCQWTKDATTGEFALQPHGNVPSVGGGTLKHYMNVYARGDSLHLLYHDYVGKTVAYRVGLDLIPLEAEEVSALAPENAPAETTGWTKVDFGTGLWSCAVLSDRVVVVEHAHYLQPIRFWEKRLDGNQPFKVTRELTVSRWATVILMESPEPDELYFVHDDPWAPTVYRYRNGNLEELAQPWESTFTRFIRWILGVARPFLVVWLVGNLTLILGAEWLSRIDSVPFQHGCQKSELAAVWRRALARCVDLGLIFGSAIWHIFQLGLNRIVVDCFEVARGSLVHQTATGRAFYQSAAWAAAIALTMVLCQARWGQTPGKWLCRVKVLRSTSYRCGLARSLMRELMLVLDLPLITVLPGIMCLLTSDLRQRIGDRMADTVVVSAGPPVSPQENAPLMRQDKTISDLEFQISNGIHGIRVNRDSFP